METGEAEGEPACQLKIEKKGLKLHAAIEEMSEWVPDKFFITLCFKEGFFQHASSVSAH